MRSYSSEPLSVRVRLMADPCLWNWEIVDGAGAVVESGWEKEWTAYEAAQEAVTMGLARLAELSRSGRGAAAPGRPAVDRPGLRVNRRVAIVAREEAALYRSLRKALAGDDRVEIVRDRRWGERRGRGPVPAVERRRGERRCRPDIDADLRSRGWSVVCVFETESKTAVEGLSRIA